MPGLGNVRRVPWVHTCSVPWQRGSRGWQERLGAGRALQEGPCCGQDEPLLCPGTGCWVGAASKMLLERQVKGGRVAWKGKWIICLFRGGYPRGGAGAVPGFGLFLLLEVDL